jgi:7-carboxy-7-deazaguanine synthase (Cx14CxxC type)
MPYSVKEIFYTLQGEGAQVGRPAVFCRFEGCNLWSGRELDRPTSVCKFCDTDFKGTDGPGGGCFETPEALAAAVAEKFPPKKTEDPKPLVVCTGGEPLLQMDGALISAFHTLGFEIAIETNGTFSAPEGIDWICVSPKAGSQVQQRFGNELKLVFPQDGLDPGEWESLDFTFFFLQPQDGPELTKNTRLAVDYCLKHPRWRLSLQMHKYIGIH